ncbi:MAG TPA: glycosyltransferase family 2 protein [Thermoanaerobaculia bacterium]|nr:glycosyltransferase family 2 protein [Thermoanaerobaculia bacterium]
MLLSIVIPSYNQGSYIRETLDSIFAQDYRPIEVLVQDGASKDDTVEILHSYDAPELRWWSEPDRGVVDAVNKGLARASGDVVAIQSSDDFYLPGAFRAAIDALTSSGAGLVYGDVEYVDAQSRVSGRTTLPPFDLYEYAGKLTYIPQASAFFTAEAMRAAGGWREDVSYAADAEYYLRIALRFPVRKIDRLLARYRYHEEQRDKMRDRVQRDWTAAVAPLLSSPDRRLRRYARSGLDLVKLRYLPEEQWAMRTRAAWHAMIVNPAVLRSAEFRATRDLFPARYPIWRTLSRIKRALGFRPRR